MVLKDNLYTSMLQTRVKDTSLVTDWPSVQLSESDLRYHNLNLLATRLKMSRKGNTMKKNLFPCGVSVRKSANRRSKRSERHTEASLFKRFGNWISTASSAILPLFSMSSSSSMEENILNDQNKLPSQDNLSLQKNELSSNTGNVQASDADDPMVKIETETDIEEIYGENVKLPLVPTDVIYLTDNDKVLKSCVYAPQTRNDDIRPTIAEDSPIALPQWRSLKAMRFDPFDINSSTMGKFNDIDFDEQYEKVHRRYELLEKRQAKYISEKQAHRLYREEVLKEKTLQRTLSDIFMNNGRLPSTSGVIF